MAARLPEPGGDADKWGQILNDYLLVSHNQDGTLRLSALASGGAYIKPAGGIPASDLAGNIPLSLLDSSTQSLINSIASHYTKPSGGIPLTDLSVTVQNSLSQLSSAYVKPSSGIPASDLAGNISLSLLDSSTQTIINSVADKYAKPSGGIPSSDMTPAVQTSLGLANTSLQPGTTISAGDLTGTYASPTVAKLQGIAVNNTTPSNNQVLAYNSTNNQWIPSTVTSSTVSDATTSSKGILQLSQDLSGTASNPTVVATHLSAPLPVAQGGSGNSTGQPSGTAGGDLSGNYPGPVVAKLQGITISGTPSSGQVLQATSGTAASWQSLASDSDTLASDTDVTISSPTNNQVLTYNSGSSKWVNQTPVAGFTDPTTTKGDLIVHGTSSTTREPVGTDGQVLTADSTQGTGIKWATPASAPVSSVFGRTGVITAQTGDYTATQVGALPSTDDLSAIATANLTAASVNLNSNKITNLANGTTATDAAAFGQVPTSAGSIGGLLAANNLSDVADAGSSRANIQIPALTPAAAVATTNVSSLSTTTTTIDGYTLVTGDMVLLTAQSTASQNGTWLVPASGNWTRPTEFSSGATIKGRTILIMNGTVYANTQWALDTPTAGITIDTTSQTWTLLGAPSGTYEPFLTPTAVKTSAYNAQPSDLVLVSTASGNVTIQLPTAPADKTVIGGKMVGSNLTNAYAASFAPGGSDAFNTAGVTTPRTLLLPNQTVFMQYQASTALWIVTSEELPLSNLKNLFPDWINVKSYGATGNGTTDDSAAIQAALNQAQTNAINNSSGSTTVFFPSGTYLHNSTLQVGNITVGGKAGPIRITGNDAFILSTTCAGINFMNQYLTAASSGATGPEMNIGLEIDHLIFDVTGGHVFYNMNWNKFHIHDCRFMQRSSNFAIFYTTTNGNNWLTGYIDNCVFRVYGTARTYGSIYIVSFLGGGIAFITFSQCLFQNNDWDNTQYQIWIECAGNHTSAHNYTNGMKFIQTVFDAAYGGAIKMLSTQGCNFDMCTIVDTYPQTGSPTITNSMYYIGTTANGTPATPGLSTSSSGGTVVDGTYEVVISYCTVSGGVVTLESYASLTAASITTSGGSTSTLTINSPAASGSYTNWYAYVTQVGGTSFTRQQASGSPTAIGTNLTLTAPPSSSGAAALFPYGSSKVSFRDCNRDLQGPTGAGAGTWDIYLENNTAATTDSVVIDTYTVRDIPGVATFFPYFNFNNSNNITVINCNGAVITNQYTSGITLGPSGNLSYSGLLLGATQPNVALPSDHSYISWSFDPATLQGNGGLTFGALYVAGFFLRTTQTISTISVWLDVVGTTLVSGQCFAGIFNSLGVLQVSSADQSAVWGGGSTGVKNASVSPTVLGAGFYWVGLLANGGAGTKPAFGRASGGLTGGSATNWPANSGLAGGSIAYGASANTYGTSLTNFTPGNTFFAGSPITLWVAVK